MFYNLVNLTDIPSTPPDLTKITRFNQTFGNARNFNDSDIASWDVSKIANMSYMFSNTNFFNVDISGWDVSSVTDMTAMFMNAKLFNQDISSWDVSKVIGMNSMFAGATAFNQPLNGWGSKTSNVTGMAGMFAVSNFNQPLNLWNTSKVTNMSGMF